MTQGKRSRKGKARAGADAAAALQQALALVVRSARYPLLKLLRPANFFAAGLGSPDLNDCSLEQLIALGAEGILAQGLPADRLAALIELLGNLAENGEGVERLENAAAAEPRRPAPLKMSSIEAENRLRRAFDCLRRQACYGRVKDLRLAEYWDTGGMRDPFLEEMTFKQLVEMRIANLLEKRSFTAWKIGAIEGVLRRCIEAEGGAWQAGESAPGTAASGGTPPPAGAAGPRDGGGASLPAEWRRPLAGPIAAALVSQLESNWRACSCSQSEAAGLLRDLPARLGPAQYAAWWLMVEHGEPETVAPLLGLSAQDAAALDRQARDAVLELLSARAPGLLAHWTAALSGPGCSFSALLAPHRDDAVSPAYFEQLARALLKTLGARRARAYGIELADYWTGNERLLEVSLQTIEQRLPLPERELREELAALLPLFDPAELIAVLAAREAAKAGR